MFSLFRSPLLRCIIIVESQVKGDRIKYGDLSSINLAFINIVFINEPKLIR